MKIYTTKGAFYSSSDMNRVYKDFPKEEWEYRYRNGNLYIVPIKINPRNPTGRDKGLKIPPV